MKLVILFVMILTMVQTGYTQKIILYRSTGGNQVFYLSSIDSLKFLPFECGDSLIYAGKTYHSVLIGTQCWLKENLDVGTMITGYPSNDGTIEKYCYNNEPDSCTIYGGLYIWDEAMQYVTTEGAKGICPDGWHMPKEAEYQTLITNVNNDANALKREDQGSGIGKGTNTSGFSALLAGNKVYSGGPFQLLGESADFYAGKNGSCGWIQCAYSMKIVFDTSTIIFGEGIMKGWGVSVRCIRDE